MIPRYLTMTEVFRLPPGQLGLNPARVGQQE